MSRDTSTIVDGANTVGTRQVERFVSGLPGHRRSVAVARMRTLVDSLGGRSAERPRYLVGEIEALLAGAPVDRMWLARSVLGASLPDDEEMPSLLRTARLSGPWAALLAPLATIQDEDDPAPVRVLTGGVTCDIHATAATDYMSGIQRVVRAVAVRWAVDRAVDFVGWTGDLRALRPLPPEDRTRVFGVREKWGTAGTNEVVVPWLGTHLVLELAADPARSKRILAMGKYSGTRVGMIGYDCIPMTNPGTVTGGMVAVFAGYLAACRHAYRIVAISEAAASEFLGWKRMLAGVREEGPEIAVVTLPVVAEEPTEQAVAEVKDRLGVVSEPMVLVVGSHEPRKNHLAVLHAAETLWREGVRFTLVLAGAGAWRSEEFYEHVGELKRAGRPMESVRGLPDDLLWAAYRAAHVTLFPSLNEGFGLPVAESLACGTPVITSDFGSTRDIVSPHGEPLGGLLVDPRDDYAIIDALRSVLTDAATYARLKSEVDQREFGDWDAYAKGVWDFLVGEGE